jgi:hypothetical protein
MECIPEIEQNTYEDSTNDKCSISNQWKMFVSIKGIKSTWFHQIYLIKIEAGSTSFLMLNKFQLSETKMKALHL